MAHNFFVQYFGKDGKELGDLRQSSHEYDLQRGLQSIVKRGVDTEHVAAIFVSTLPDFELDR